jgi:hypothetical protein
MHVVTKTVLVGSLCVAATIAATQWVGCQTRTHDNHSDRESKGPVWQKTLSETSVQAQMKNVDFRIDETITLRIHDLRGQLVGTKNGPPTFDDKLSFRVSRKLGEGSLFQGVTLRCGRSYRHVQMSASIMGF